MYVPADVEVPSTLQVEVQSPLRLLNFDLGRYFYLLSAFRKDKWIRKVSF